MKKTNYRHHFSFVLAAISPLLLSACGGGSGSDAPVVTPTQTPNTPAVPLAQKQEQTITPFNVTPMKVGDSTTVTATASSGLPLVYSSDTTAVCTVTPTGVVTAVAYGTCTIAANQFGNDSYRQITAHASALVIGTQTLSLVLPQLIVGENIPLVFKSTAAVPVTLTSNTPSTCTVLDGVVTVISTVPAACTITASQDGVVNYLAAATPVAQTTNIVAATSATASNAIATPTLPQDGSLVNDLSADHQGFYYNSSGGSAFVDSSNNITYFDSFGVLFGALKFTSSSWVLDSSSVYYSYNPHVLLAPTGSVTLTSKTNLQATALSFNTNPSPLNLTYSTSNAYAVDTKILAGNWYTNTATSRIQVVIDIKGNITGTLVTLNPSGLPSRCVLTGTVLSLDANTSHNLFKLSLTATSDKSTGTTCALTNTTFQGPAVERYWAVVASNPANGLFANLVSATHSTDSYLLGLNLLRENP